MKHIQYIFTAILIAAAIAVSAQSPRKLDYGVNFGGEGKYMDVDAQGNAYVVGNFDGSQSFGSFTLNSNGQEDVFVIKISPTGTILRAVNFGGDLGELVAGIDVDNNGNVYIAGSFNGHVDFDPGAGNVGLEPFDDYDGYLLKLTTNLDYAWVVTVEGYLYNEVTGVSVDASSNVFITGTFNTDGQIVYTNTSADIISDSESTFFAKLNAGGQRAWEKTLGNDNSVRGTGVAIDAAGSPVFTGYHAGTIFLNYDNGTGDPHTASIQDVFMIKANPTNGAYVWGRSFGGSGVTYIASIFADPQNNIYVGGEFTGTGDFDPGSGTKTFSSAGSADIFVSKFNASGTWIWSNQYGADLFDGAHDLFATATDVYITGDFTNDINIPNIGTAGDIDGFILNLDNNGNFKWAGQLGGPTDDDFAYNIAGVGGAVFVNGVNTSRPNDVDPSCQELDLDPETAPSYVIRIGTLPSDCLTITKQPVGSDVCAGETVVLTIEATGTGVSYQWLTYDNDGGYTEIEDVQGYYSGSKTPTLTITTGNDDKGENGYLVLLRRGNEVVYSEDAYVSVGPDSPFANDIINCGAGSVTITAQGGSNGQYRWYTASTGGTAIPGATGSVYTTPFITATTSYWVAINDGTCESPRKEVIVNITSCEQPPALKWAKGFGGPNTDDASEPIILADGNLLIAGSFQGTMDFDPGVGVTNLTANGGDGFLMKITPDAELVWVKQFTGANSTVYPGLLQEDASGNIYMAGHLAGTGSTDFDGGAGSFPLAGTNTNNDIFIMKYDKDGNVIWGKRMGNAPNQDSVTDMKVDASGVYMVGHFFNTLSISGAANTLTSAGGTDIFMLKLSHTGDVTWLKQIGNSFALGNTQTDVAHAFFLKGNEFFLSSKVTTTNGPVDVDPGAGVTTVSGNDEAWLGKYDTDGNFKSVVLRYSTPDADGSSNIFNILVDDNNNIYTSGNFIRTIDFDPSSATFEITSTGGLTNSPASNAFICKHNSSGGLIWAKALHVQNLNGSYGGILSIADNGDLIISGMYQGSVDFDPGPLEHIMTGESLFLNSYLLKLSASGEYNWAINLSRYENVSSSAGGGGHVVDANGDIYMMGSLSGSVDFDPHECSYKVQAVGATDFYLWKLSFDVANICYQIEPESEDICAGEVISLYAEAFGAPGISYQWQFSVQPQSGFTDINDGNGYSGTKTSELKVDTKAGFGEGFYRAIAKAPKAQDITSATALLSFVGITPNAPTTTSAATCQPSADLLLKASGTANGNYLWYDVATGGFPYQGATTDSFQTGTITSSVTYYVAILDGSCVSPRTPVVGSIDVGNQAPTVVDGTRCGTGTVTLSALGATDGQYRWYTAAQGGTAISGQNKSTFTTPSLTVTTSYYVSIALTDCESPRSEVIANIGDLRTLTNMSTKGCVGLTSTLIVPAGSGDVYWYANASGTSLLQIGDTFITPQLPAGTTSYYFKVMSGNCESAVTRWDVEATDCANNQPPVIEAVKRPVNIGGIFEIDLLEIISDPDNNLDPLSLKIISQPTSQASASLTGTILTVDYTGLTFANEDKVVIEACDIAGSCVQQTVTIVVSSNIVVYNAISPNDDGKNDVFFIEFIDSYDDTRKNKVSVFNRWGDLVFEVNDYNNTTNVFKGKNKNGNDLASGTYFYKIEFENRKTETGYLSLKR